MQEREMTGGKRKNNIMKTRKVIHSSEKPDGGKLFTLSYARIETPDDINVSHEV